MHIPRLHGHAGGRCHRGDAAQGVGGIADVAVATLADGDVEGGGLHVNTQACSHCGGHAVSATVCAAWGSDGCMRQLQYLLGLMLASIDTILMAKRMAWSVLFVPTDVQRRSTG